MKFLRQFEPFAPLYEERVEVLKYLIEHQYLTNVMMEPYLSDPIPIIMELSPLLETQEETEWVIVVGKMNYTKSMQLNQDSDESDRMKEYLDSLYSTKNLKKLWAFVKPNLHLFLKKDTVMALLKLI